MAPWQPVSQLEQHLSTAFHSGDLGRALALLRDAEFALPITEAAAAGETAPAWATATDAGRTWVLAFTSIEAMLAAAPGTLTRARVSSFHEMAAGWPDTRWGLAVNVGVPVHFLLESGTVARLAAPTLGQSAIADPASAPVVMQKVIAAADLASYLLDGRTRISGYVHRFRDVAHIATPAVLTAALTLADDTHLDGSGSVYAIRWYAVGDDLYRVPLGGVDEERRDAVAGEVIEEPPFVGTGFAPNVDQVIHEYKLDGVGLPQGAEVWELDVDGAEHRRAYLDLLHGRWLAVTAVPTATQDEDGPA